MPSRDRIGRQRTGREDRGDAEPGRRAQAPLATHRGAHLPCQRDLPEGRQRRGRGKLGARAVQRQGNRQIGGHVTQPHAAGDVHVDVAIQERELHRALQHGGDAGDPAGVDPIGDDAGTGALRRHHQRLHLHAQHARAFVDRGDRDAGRWPAAGRVLDEP